MVEATRPLTALTWTQSQTISSSRNLASPEALSCIWWNYSERCVGLHVALRDQFNFVFMKYANTILLCSRVYAGEPSAPEPSVLRSRCWRHWVSTHRVHSRHLWGIRLVSARRQCQDVCPMWREPWWRKRLSSSRSTGTMMLCHLMSGRNDKKFETVTFCSQKLVFTSKELV